MLSAITIIPEQVEPMKSGQLRIRRPVIPLEKAEDTNAIGSDRHVNNQLHAIKDSRIVPVQKIFGYIIDI